MMNTKFSFVNKLLVGLSIFAVLVVLVFPALAIATEHDLPDGGDTSPSGISNPLNDITSIPQFLEKIFEKIVIPIGFSIATLMIIYSGFLFVVAQGNPTKLEKAKTAFLWTVIGTAVLLGSWAIASVIEATINDIRG
ncbi:hypothetical protein COB55_01740 [Candidatus Wolfebacteria bacterium]|nr:MAG: hypothetical protein COB55_01740 [Candidatus Wolfebacteria bacterium]